MTTMPAYARALKSRNYRLYFAGQLISLAGTWVQHIAMIWLAYRLSNSALVLGLVGFASQIPSLLFAPLSGVLIDRFDRRRVLLWTQALSMLQALLLAVLTWQQWVTPQMLIVLGFVLGCINAVDFPARQSFAVQLVDDPADLSNAIALNSTLMNAGRFVGPALAGFIVAVVGEAVCFLLNGLSFLAVLVALSAIRTSAPAGKLPPGLHALVEGYRYVFGQRQIRLSLLLVASISFFVMPYSVMMPLFAKEIFGGDARTYGMLIGCAGAGTLLASLFLVFRKETQRLSRWVGLAAPLAGASLALFALTSYRWQAFPVLLVLGFSAIMTLAGSNTLIQARVEERFRGRVMALFAMAALGIAPLGNLAIGFLAEAYGIRPALVAFGVAMLLAGLAYRSFAVKVAQRLEHR